jgi:hypothetical protein
MRYSKVIVANGTLRSNTLGLRHAFVGVVIGVGVVWAGIAFAQEGYIGHKLSQQATDLRKQNSVVAAQNQGYKKDVQAITSGSADEEEARLNGYARPSEKLYLVTAVPTPSPTPSAPASPRSK